MKIKIDENGNAVVDENSFPIYLFEDGDSVEEKPVDVPALFTKIKELNNEAKQHRLKKNELAEKYKVIEEMQIEDVESFIKESVKNSELVSNFNDKDFKSAAEVEKIKQGVKDSYEEKMRELEKSMNILREDSSKMLSQKDANIRSLLIKGAFDSSDFIREKTVLPADIAYDTFGKYFHIEESDDGSLRVFAVNKSGDKLFSRTNPGEYANTDEAIELIIKEYARSNDILRASSGGDDPKASPSRRGRQNSEQLMTMPPTERLKYVHRSGKQQGA